MEAQQEAQQVNMVGTITTFLCSAKNLQKMQNMEQYPDAKTVQKMSKTD